MAMFDTRFIRPTILRLKTLRIHILVTKHVIHRRHLKRLADIDVPSRILVKLVVCLELRHKHALILFGIVDPLAAQTEREVEARRELFAVGSVKCIARARCILLFLGKIHSLALIGISPDQGIGSHLPSLLHIEDFAVQHSIGISFLFFDIIVSINLAIVIAKDCMDAVFLALINEIRRMPIIFEAIVIFCRRLHKMISGLFVLDAAARNIAFRIVVVQGQLIRERNACPQAILLSLANPPIDP